MIQKKCLGSIHGVGALVAESHVYGDISYFIEVWREQYCMIRTDGIIDARIEIIDRARQTEDLVLILATGEKVRIVITDIISGHAEIRIFGPVASLADYREISQFSQLDVIDLANYSVSPRSR